MSKIYRRFHDLLYAPGNEHLATRYEAQLEAAAPGDAVIPDCDVLQELQAYEVNNGLHGKPINHANTVKILTMPERLALAESLRRQKMDRAQYTAGTVEISAKKPWPLELVRAFRAVSQQSKDLG